MNLRSERVRRGTYLRSLFLSFFFLASSDLSISHGQSSSPEELITPRTSTASDIFRLEKLPVDGGAELITLHARLNGLEQSGDDKWVPLVSVLRDTLGDLKQENDRLRYLWPLTYTRPTLKQRISASVPFLYTRMGNNKNPSEKVPPPVMDLAAPERQVWEKIFWTALQNVLLEPYGLPVKASSHSYRRNITDYRRSQIVRALSVLSLYHSLEGTAAFSEAEMAEIQGRLLLTDKTFGGLIDDLHLQRYYEKRLSGTRDDRGHNWELLRQHAEAESLYFEPLQMPDGSATHALVWIAKRDLATGESNRYGGRFLNISDPWSDKRLLHWQGYVETRYLDSDSRAVAADSPGAEAVEMIPLALYGLDNPKIPMLLVDFRDAFNPKKREMSRRVLEDVAQNVLRLSGVGGVSFFLGRTVFDIVTGRRGMDINQPSRLRTYSQLKLLLSLTESLDPKLRDEIDHRLEKVSLNPMENDLTAEANLASKQYEALVAYARRPDGLPAKLDRDRRAELVPLEHGKSERVLFRVANILSIGKYTHRESTSPDMVARLSLTRSVVYHTKFLRQVARSTPRIDVVWNLEEVKRSLQFIADNGSEADNHAIAAVAKIFTQTEDNETRMACLESLSRIPRRKAKHELLRLAQDKTVNPAMKETITAYLNGPAKPEELLPTSGANGMSNRVEQR